MTIEYDQVTIEIVNTVALYLSRLESGDKFDVTGRLFMLDKVSVMVQAQQPIRFVLPAFPMKSPSPSKVLGPLPDRGEEIALLQLENFCRSIQDVYVHGAIVIIVSDGVVYQGLLM
jgi:pyoverdine/dityrosine biosynthesis protein Dit1